MDSHFSVLADQIELELREIANAQGEEISRQLVTFRHALFRSSNPEASFKNISSSETGDILCQYGEILCDKIRSQLISINPYHALAILCRLPWLIDRRNKSENSVVNRHRILRQILVSELKSRKNKEAFTPKVDEYSLLPILLLEQTTTELLYVQTVYRSIQKARFFGSSVEVKIQNDMYSLRQSKDVELAIKTYEYRKQQYFDLFEAVQNSPPEHSKYFGLTLTQNPNQFNCLTPFTVNEDRVPFKISRLENSSRIFKYLCVPIETVGLLKEILSNCCLSKLDAAGIDAIGSLLCISAIQKQLLSIQRKYTSKKIYKYDLEKKGYIIINNPKTSNNLLKLLILTIEDLNISKIFPDMERFLKDWLALYLYRNTQLPKSLDFEPHIQIGVELGVSQIVLFPDSLTELQRSNYEKLCYEGGQAGSFFGSSFENWAISQLDDYLIKNDKLELWIKQQELYVLGSRNKFKEVDYAIISGDTLFLIDMKYKTQNPALHKLEAKKNWNTLKLGLIGSTDKKAQAIWKKRYSIYSTPDCDGESVFPPAITCIIPITCTSRPLFCKATDQYKLWAGQEHAPYLRACTIQELIEVLDAFDIEEYKRNNFFVIPSE